MDFIMDENVASDDLCKVIELYKDEDGIQAHTATKFFGSDRKLMKFAINSDSVLISRDLDIRRRVKELREEGLPAPKGLVMIIGDPNMDKAVTNERLAYAINVMLGWLERSTEEELDFVDVQIDKGGIGYRSRLKVKKGGSIMVEYRQVYDLSEKLDAYSEAARLDHVKRYGEGEDPEVNSDTIVSEHGNLLREDLEHIRKRIDLARNEGIEVNTFNSLAKVIFNKEKEFEGWISKEVAKSKRGS